MYCDPLNKSDKTFKADASFFVNMISNGDQNLYSFESKRLGSRYNIAASLDNPRPRL